MYQGTLYRVAVRSATATTGANMTQLRAAASERLRLRSILIVPVTTVATGMVIAIGRPSAHGNPTTTVLGQAVNPGDPAGTGTATTVFAGGGNAPTQGTIFLYRIIVPAALGQGVYLEMDDDAPIVIPASGSILMHAILGAASAACDVTWTWEE